MDSDSVRINPEDYSSFSFDSYSFDSTTGQANFRFSLKGAEVESLEFEEQIVFQSPKETSDLSAVSALLPVLGAVLGVSYYKISAPKKVELAAGEYTKAALELITGCYTLGLGEFAYRAGLAAIPNPEFIARVIEPVAKKQLPDFRLTAPLVPVGGGKDSAVTATALAEAGLVVTPFAVRPNQIIKRVAALAERELVVADRKLDPRLFALNEAGALNGHVPVTAMNSLISVLQSLLLELGPVVMSNESSASEATLIWDGVEVNHQWSKSLAAEELISQAIEAQTGYSQLYFSLLRPFTELKIARAFSRTNKYDSLFVSCNRAFRIHGAEPSWCGDCPKCRFVFLAFAPFMSVERLSSIFGKNLYEDLNQLSGFKALIGLANHKPFECVGEEAESVVAINLAARDPQWQKTAVLKALAEESEELSGLLVTPQEQQVFENRPALPLPSQAYQKARDAIN